MSVAELNKKDLAVIFDVHVSTIWRWYAGKAVSSRHLYAWECMERMMEILKKGIRNDDE